jgi:outer membrane protein OmpA-like peptidoglycan-associated protein
MRIAVRDLMDFQKRYFLPGNCTVSVLGGFSEKTVLDKLQNIFKSFKSQEFNPELIDKVIDFKPMINTIQLLSHGADTSLATLTYQNPGARQDRGATYCAYVLTSLINDKEGRIQRALADSGLTSVRASYFCNNFYGTLVLSARPSGDSFFAAFSALNHLIADVGRKDYFQPEEIEKAKKDIAVEFNDLKANDPKGYQSFVVRYRFTNDENYFSAMVDSINAVTVDHMRLYVDDYLTAYSCVRDLIVPDSAMKNAPPDQQYFPLDESVGDIRFTYDLNKTEIETDEARQNLRRIIQWLRINTDMHVQVNGFSDEGEFVKSYDDSVLRFIDSTVTFHKAMPDVTRKGYLRIEFMRAMRIAKALYEAGITPDRITGTSMVFTSDTKEAAAANRKCTITLEKIKPHPSLYEYHFGHKKPEDDTGWR